MPEVKYDCRYFMGDRPCMPNKQHGVFCGSCAYYEKDENTDCVFPEIPEPQTDENPDKEKNIIIVKLDAVGDVLRTTSILPSLKEKYPDSNITWITKEKSYDVLKDNTLIDEIYFISDEPEHIYSGDFDIGINLDSGLESCAIMSRIYPKQGFGYTLHGGRPFPVNTLAAEWYLMGIDDNRKKENRKTYHKIIHEICGLKYQGSCPFLEMPAGKLERSKIIAEAFGMKYYDGLILVNLGGGSRWQYKKWVKEGYARLIELLAGQNIKRGIGIIAGEEDREFYEEISAETAGLKNVIRFGCKNSTGDFICIVSLFDKVFTSDSLCMHIATSLDKYTVVITGPTSHTELDVFGSGEIIYSRSVDCLCCYLNRCDKQVTCMNTVSAEEVFAKLA